MMAVGFAGAACIAGFAVVLGFVAGAACVPVLDCAQATNPPTAIRIQIVNILLMKARMKVPHPPEIVFVDNVALYDSGSRRFPTMSRQGTLQGSYFAVAA
jgi:hypothetical protein